MRKRQEIWGRLMNEEQFRSELYRHLVNEIETNKLKLKVKVEERCLIPKEVGAKENPRADIVIYDQDDVDVLIIETKRDNSKMLEAVTQVYRYGFLFGMPGYGFVAVCTPSLLCLYKYDGELGDLAYKTPKDVEGGIYLGGNGRGFSWETESSKRLVEEHKFDEKPISDIAQRILDFIHRRNLG